jgi:hypothetical protein
MYFSGKLTKYMDIPPPGISKENKTKIFMGIIGILALLVVLFLVILFCRRPQNRKKICKLQLQRAYRQFVPI